ncbi:class I SAM-dependent methyltransferase [Aromatoleum sp.]|uniref:class I SAM-dependent methyltransferase n=1 Tax=Aromatoleum sp. TaxID=2307007 RepID=UPI002FC8EF53
MHDAVSGPVRLPFSEKYDRHHAQAYLEKHRDGLARRLSHWRDEQLARTALALAGDPTLVLDLPCGAGRFWPLLAERAGRIIIGADNSAAMLDVALAAHPPSLVERVRTLRTSAFDIELPDRSVDCIFSMRLAHHIGDATHRVAMLREFHRVARDTVILSLWVDGNYKAWKRRQLEEKRAQRGESGVQNRFVLPARTVEQEFRSSGFRVLGHFDFLPRYAMWRVYVLRRSGT